MKNLNNIDYDDFLRKLTADKLRIYINDMQHGYDYAVADGNVHNMGIYKKWLNDAVQEQQRRVNARLAYINKKGYFK